MKKTSDIKNVVSKNTSKWKENAEYRIKNRWLRYSSQIARRVLSAIEDDKELNQAELAKRLNVSQQQISKIVKGHENLTLETIYKLGQALKVELISFPSYKYGQYDNIELSISATYILLISVNYQTELAGTIMLGSTFNSELATSYQNNILMDKMIAHE